MPAWPRFARPQAAASCLRRPRAPPSRSRSGAASFASCRRRESWCSLLAQRREIVDDILDLWRAQRRLALKRRRDALETVDSIIRRHDRVGVEPARIRDPQPQLTLGPASAASLQVRCECAMELLLREGPAVAEQAEPHLAVNDDAAPALHIALRAGQRAGDSISDDRIRTQLLLAARAIRPACEHRGERDRREARATTLSRKLRW